MSKKEETKMNLVQEVAKSCRNSLPSSYILKEEDRPTGEVPIASDVPVIDLSRLNQSDGVCPEAEKLRMALQSWGMFQAVGHGMSLSLLNEMRDVGKKFFQLPLEEKQQYSVLKEGTAFKFEGYGNDHVAREDQILNWMDRLFLVAEPESIRKTYLWPRDPPSFRGVLNEYTKGVRKALEQVLRSMAKLLELEEDYFINQLNGSEAHARFNYFPACSRPDLVFGIRPHGDGSFVTIVLPDKEVDGLQVFKNGSWYKVPIIPQALVINLGNQMEIMCNGMFRSPIHRVVANKEERASLAFFYLLDEQKELEPAQELVNKTRPRMYDKVKVKDFNEAHFKNVSLGLNVLDLLKI